ncbi:sodium-dependent transporter [Sediminitomix flava]|uniref:NSS family neurotransmitter:Na+ symporter n=1 Tax=Sediminitomix flava TaxID=379075 RepID=A0A315Z723_SEDFL|nr:sodium-dependent transporter [Sediminitomix flava]PWJ40123.1 NSS family neurotransmitter:Na+ symporter [Sediminitomix flava]
MNKTQEFSSRWGLILASLGMAVGAGNLWRFPRLAGQYGGTFIVLWIFFLLIWSIPILLSEFSIGKKFKGGVVSSYAQAAGKKYTWLGFFIAVCTLGITFYYSVVTAWGLRYLFLATQNLVGTISINESLQSDPQFLQHFWSDISSENISTVILHIIALIVAGVVLYRGVQEGLEKANKILIPTLFGMLILIGLIAVNIGNGIHGLEYMYQIDTSLFKNPTVWIEAVTQSAWSTGAGWGLMLTISSYSRKNEDVSLNIFISGFGNNTASLIAGMAIIPSVFALASSDQEALAFLQSGNFALTFTIIPKLFNQFPGGDFLSVFFFLAFFFAAFSSLLTMIEMFIKMLDDLGFDRKKATVIVIGICMVMGLPSAYSLDFFANQDWVWGLGLIISGMAIAFAVHRYGISLFKKEFIDVDSEVKLNSTFFRFTIYLIIPLGFTLLWWWMSQGYSKYPWFDEEGNWNVFDVYSNATILTQWVIVFGLGIILNNLLYKKFVHKKEAEKVIN